MSHPHDTKHPVYQDLKRASAAELRRAMLIGAPAIAIGMAAAWTVAPGFPVVLFCLWAFSKAQGHSHNSTRLNAACRGFLAQAELMRSVQCQCGNCTGKSAAEPEAAPDYDDPDWWKKA